MKKVCFGIGCAVLMACALVVSLRASAPSGAIFTTVAAGSEVNCNIY